MLVLIMTFSALSVNAQRGQQDDQRRGRRAQMDQRGLRGQMREMIPNLTEEQKGKMKALRLDMQKSKLPIENELREKKARMRTLSTADNPDMKAINKLIEEMGDLKVKLGKLKASHHQEVRKQLTEEQRVFFDSHSQQRMHKRMRGHHKMRREFSGN